MGLGRECFLLLPLTPWGIAMTAIATLLVLIVLSILPYHVLCMVESR